MRMTEQEFADYTAKRGKAKPTVASPQNRMYALGRLKTGEMNKLESSYAAHLEELKRSGEILWFKFEGIKLRLADNTFFSPDFFVMLADGTLEARETKGFMKDDAAVKLKCAAAIFPLRFVLVRKRPAKDGGGWIETEV